VVLARAFESAGVQMLTVHGRTREQGYCGHAEYDTIAAVKAADAPYMTPAAPESSIARCHGERPGLGMIRTADTAADPSRRAAHTPPLTSVVPFPGDDTVKKTASPAHTATAATQSLACSLRPAPAAPSGNANNSPHTSNG